MDGMIDPLPGGWPPAADPEPGMPPVSVAAMPVQSLTTFDPAARRPLSVAWTYRWRRGLVFGAAAAITAAATYGIQPPGRAGTSGLRSMRKASRWDLGSVIRPR